MTVIENEQKKIETLKKHIISINSSVFNNELLAINILTLSPEKYLDEILRLGTRILKAEYFFNPYNQQMFKIIKSMAEKGDKNVSAWTAINSISNEDWDKIPALLRVSENYAISKKQYMELCYSVSSYMLVLFENPLTHAKSVFQIIIDQYLKEIAVNILDNATAMLKNTARETQPQEQLLTASEQINQLLTKTSYKVSQVEDYTTRMLKSLNYQAAPYIRSQFQKLDAIIDGFQVGQLVTIGAVPGTGKTAFALNLALNFCQQGEKVSFWCFEMSKVQLDRRIFAIRTGCTYDANGKYSEEDYNIIMQYLKQNEEKIQGSQEQCDDIQIHTKLIYNLEEFLLSCRALKLQKSARNVIIIDYIQMISDPKTGYGHRVQEIEKITRSLKSIALELGLLIIILSQLSRKISDRSDNTPILSDLKESGAIEQDSDIVMFLSNSKTGYSFDLSERLINITVAKNRNGKIGQCSLRYIGARFKFTD